ncbi:MAG TPA: hypothetical protein VM261_02900 [Kofleriaceae bacterium]|nr:hypothetical protein [Kofleriaceae bacterium]
MRALATMAAMSLGAACGGAGEAGPDAGGDYEGRFDIDVVVDSWGVGLWLRDTDPSCEPEEHFPHVGQCEQYGDGFGCSGPFDPCPRRVAVERDGVVLGEIAGFGWPMGDQLRLDPLPETADLVIERCGVVHRVPLPLQRPDPPVLTDLTTDGVETSGTVTTSAGTSGIVTSVNFGLGGESCHSANGTSWRAAFPTAPGDLDVAAVREAAPSDSPWGTVRLWSRSRSPSIGVVWPTEVAPDRWRIGVPQPPTWNVEVDSEPFVDMRWSGLAWEVVMTADGPRHQLTSGAYFVYEAGATTDNLRVLLTNGWHTATVPHVVPSDELAFSLGDNGHFQLALGPVTMTNENNPSLTRTLAFTVAWDHPVVPRPEP